jgi:hypothetical protein
MVVDRGDDFNLSITATATLFQLRMYCYGDLRRSPLLGCHRALPSRAGLLTPFASRFKTRTITGDGIEGGVSTEL